MRKLGFEIETLALQYLQTKGFELCYRNFYSRQGEIDLVGFLENFLVFVEVRFRKNILYGLPEDSISTNKRKKLIHTAGFFLKRFPRLRQHHCRFDVIAVTCKEQDYVITWIPNAFSTNF